MSTFSLYDATLGTLELTEANGILVEEFEPGAPEVRGVTYDRPGSHGFSDESRFFSGRNISIMGKFRATSTLTRDEITQQLAAYLLPNKRPLLRWTRDGVTREISVRVDKMEQKVLIAVDDFHVTWRAEPFWRSLELKSFTIPYSTAGDLAGATFPWFETGGGVNLEFTDGVNAEIEVTNNGVVDVFPEITFYGDANSPTISNLTYDELIKVGYNMGEGDTLVVDNYAHTAVLNGVTNVFSSIDFDLSTWWALRPGTQKIQLITDSVYGTDDPPFAIVSFTERFM